MSDLAKRAVACKGWRWMPGMLAKHPNWMDYRVCEVGLTGMFGACRYASPMGGVDRAVVALPVPTSSDVLPDLTDPATLGCLLALVREAWGDPYVYVLSCAPDWFTVCSPAAEGGKWLSRPPIDGSIEAEALVAALEAAEGREVSDE